MMIYRVNTMFVNEESKKDIRNEKIKFLLSTSMKLIVKTGHLLF